MNCLTCIFCERPGVFEPCRMCLAVGGYPKYYPLEKPQPQKSNAPAPVARPAPAAPNEKA